MQLDIFEMYGNKFIIDKPIRLIELFGGIGSQAKALKNIGVDFEHYRLVEFDKYACASYNAVHGTNFKTLDIRDVKGSELGITDKDKYIYIMTYSFPCTDLSIAGLQMGMSKGSGTRSGLLWEVERLLNEVEELPQILLMENVPQVHADKNKADFDDWCSFLEKKGYSNYAEDLNSKDFGVPQNRERTFMVSILGDYYYRFPEKQKLKIRFKDMLEESVDNKYYITSEKAQTLIDTLILEGKILTDRKKDRQTGVDLCSEHAELVEISNTIAARYDAGIINHKYEHTGVIEITGCILKSQGAEFETFTDLANTLMARDYKGFGNQSANGVLECQELKF